MKCSKVIAFLMTLLFVTALFSIGAGDQGLNSEEAKKPEEEKVGYSIEEDIAKNPLKPPDTSSPRATLVSFLHNINRAYTLLMDAHRLNMDQPGLFTSESVRKMEKHAELFLQRGAHCLNLSGVPDELKQDVGYEKAIKLKEIFDRIELPPFEEIPGAKPVEVEEEKKKIAEEKEKIAEEKEKIAEEKEKIAEKKGKIAEKKGKIAEEKEKIAEEKEKITEEKEKIAEEKEKIAEEKEKIAEEKEKIAVLNRWKLPNTEIFIAKVEEGSLKGEFLFEPETIARIDEFYDKVQILPYKLDKVISHDFFDFYINSPGLLLPPKWSQWLPTWSNAIYFEQPVWQWCALVVLPLAALLVVWMFVRWWHPRSTELSSGKKSAGWILVVLVALVTVMFVKYVLDEHVNITGPMITFVESTLQRIFILLLAALVLWEIMKSRIHPKIKDEVQEEESWGEEMGAGGSRSETLFLLMRKLIMAVMLAIVLLLLLSSMGINIGPLLAGAGVIGLAIGFGAQTLVRDIISGVFFLMDDAFRIGDYIEAGSIKGTVEHISVRSLRLRHHRGMLITVPFGDMQSVMNYSRDYVIMKLDFRVRYDTNVDKVRKIIKKINIEIMKDEEMGTVLLDKIKSQGVKEMDDSAMIMRVKFMCVPGKQFILRREVYRRIQEAFQKNGIEFAHRNVTVYFPPEPSTTESESKGHEKKAESKTPDQKKKEAAAAAALRTIEEEQKPEDKPDEP